MDGKKIPDEEKNRAFGSQTEKTNTIFDKICLKSRTSVPGLQLQSSGGLVFPHLHVLAEQPTYDNQTLLKVKLMLKYHDGSWS